MNAMIDLLERGFVHTYNHTSDLVNRKREGEAKVKSAAVGVFEGFNNIDSMQNARKVV